MFKKIFSSLIAFMILFSSASVVNGYSGTDTINPDTGKSSLLNKSLEKKSFSQSAFKIGSKESAEPSADKASGKPVNKTNTIVLKFRNIDDADKSGISEKITGKYANIDTVTIEIPQGADASKIIAKYKKNPLILNAYVDKEVRLFSVPTDPYYSTYQWNLKRIGMETAWDITHGESSVIIAVIDTGFGPFSDIDGFVNGVDTSGLTILEDTYPGQYSFEGSFHGTAVTSLIASNLNTSGIAGISPNVTIMPVKVFPNGSTTTGSTQIIAGIYWAADHGADIINMSLGSNEDDPAEKVAVNYALNKGIIVVAASGNDGYGDFVSYPAAYPGVIAVGSTNKTDLVSAFSNEGSQLGISAPGEGVYLANITGGTNSFANFNGTSFSSPTVAAVASLIKSEHPEFSSDQIRQILFTGTDDISVRGWDSSSGYGITNAKKALDVAAEPDLFDGNDTVKEAAKLLANMDVTGRNYPALDNDYYKFTLYQASSITIIVTPNGLQDIVINLYDEAIQPIRYIDDASEGAEERTSLTLQAGTYYISTYDYFGDAYKTDEYQIRVVETDTLAPQITLWEGATILPSGSTSMNDLNVTIEDTSNVTVSAIKDSAEYPWPQNGLFTESGTYTITATDALGNASGIEFTIQKTGEFLVTFNSQGGSAVGAVSVPVDTTFVSPDQPTKTGYTFAGWYKEATCTNAWDFDTSHVTQNLTLYAKWVINQYTFGFDSQGGNAISAKVFNYLGKATAPASPTKSGYTFAGWYKDLTFATLWNFASDAVIENTVIYAKWIANPSAVLAFKAESAGYNSIKLSWTQVTGVTYEIYRATSSTGTYVKLGDVSSATYTSTGLTTGYAYYFKVRPYKAEGIYKAYGSYSAIVSMRPIPSTVKATVASSSYTSIRTSWVAIPGASGYQVYRALSSTGTYYLIATTTATSYLNSYLTTNRAYYYKVRAYRTVGTTRYYGAFSAIVMTRPVPSAPSLTSVVSLSSTSIRASWASVAGASRYEIYRSTSLTGVYTYQYTTSYLSYTKITLVKGTTYYYKVRCYRIIGTSRVYSNFSIVKKVVVGY
ncbi:MAG: S8 family serine peptidase [Erysipelotrichaceae bacterium]